MRGFGRGVIAAALTVVALASAPLGAQDARLASRLDARTLAAMTRVVDSARAQSLPTEPLIQKALQGSAKRAPSDRVLAAARALLAELAMARSALGRNSTEAELVAGASALHAGIPAATLTHVRELLGDRSVTVALATLADLVARGVPVAGAVNAVAALAGRNVPDAEFMAFSGQVGRDIAAGAPPAVAARVRAAGARPAGAGPVKPTGRPAIPPPGGRPPTGQRPPARP